jgi:hypothetical protein
VRRFGFWLGVVLLACGALAGLYELATWARGAHAPSSLGSIWFLIHGNSLVGFQALIENRVSPAAWPPIQALLIWPAWLALTPPGLVLTLLCWPRKETPPPGGPA